MKTLGRLASAGLSVTAFVALAVGPPQASAAPERPDKISSSVSAYHGVRTDCRWKWAATNLEPNTSYQANLFKGVRTESTWALLSPYLVNSNSATSDSNGTIRSNDVYVIGSDPITGWADLTVILYASGVPGPVARDITVANHCTE